MTNEIAACITELYGKPDYKKFTELCNKKIIFRQEFYDILNHGVEYSDVPMEETAAHDFYIKFRKKIRGDFHIEYHSIVSISRLIPVVSLSMDSRHNLIAKNNIFFTKRLSRIFYKKAIVSFLTRKKMNML